MEFEDIIDDLGAFGHWQRVIFVLICVADIFGAFSVLVPVFSGATPKWQCNTYEYEDSIVDARNLPNTTDLMQCTYNETLRCTNFTFKDDFTSIVSEVRNITVIDIVI